MGFIKRTVFEPMKKISPVTPDGKMTNNTIAELFRLLNELKEVKELHGFYAADQLRKVYRDAVWNYDLKKKLEDMDSRAKGKYNAYTVIYAVNSEQVYGSYRTSQFGTDVSRWPREEILKCAEENCNKLVDVINHFLSSYDESHYKQLFNSLEATLMNKDFKIIKIPGYGVNYTDVLLKIAYKKTI